MSEFDDTLDKKRRNRDTIDEYLALGMVAVVSAFCAVVIMWLALDYSGHLR